MVAALVAASLLAGGTASFDDRTCGTQAVRQAWLEIEAAGGQPLDSRPTVSGTEQTWVTPDGHFMVHYTLEGEDAVADVDQEPANGVPDYVDLIAEGLHTTYVFAVEKHGFPAPLPDHGVGGDDRLDIYLGRLPMEGAFGLAYVGEPDPETPERDASGYIHIQPNNDAFLGEVFAASVAGHELFHTIQYAMDYGEAAWVDEATATWQQILAFDMVHELLAAVNYLLGGRYDLVHESLVSRIGRLEYANALFFQYLGDRLETDFELGRDLWGRFQQSPTGDSVGDLEALLAERGLTSLADAFADFSVWNLLSCSLDDGQHYTYGAFCTTSNDSVRPEAILHSYPATVVPDESRRPQPLGASYVLAIPDHTRTGVTLDFSGDARATWRLALVTLDRACGTTTQRVDVPSSGEATAEVADWSQLLRLYVVVQNLSDLDGGLQPMEYELTLTPGPASGTTAPEPPSDDMVEVVLLPGDLELESVGDHAFLAAIGRREDCRKRNLSGFSEAGWGVGNTEVVQVDEDGRVTGLAEGRTKVRAYHRGLTSDPVTVTVGDPPPDDGGGDDTGCRCQGDGGSGGALAGLLVLVLLGLRRRASRLDPRLPIMSLLLLGTGACTTEQAPLIRWQFDQHARYDYHLTLETRVRTPKTEVEPRIHEVDLAVVSTGTGVGRLETVRQTQGIPASVALLLGREFGHSEPTTFFPVPDAPLSKEPQLRRWSLKGLSTPGGKVTVPALRFEDTLTLLGREKGPGGEDRVRLSLKRTGASAQQAGARSAFEASGEATFDLGCGCYHEMRLTTVAKTIIDRGSHHAQTQVTTTAHLVRTPGPTPGQ